MKTITLLLLLVLTTSAYAQSKAAIVKFLKGEADVLTLGKTTRLKLNDWVPSGAVIKTGEKSYVKLMFIDKSQMNISQNSEMKIESFSGKDSGVIDLVKGQIRSQVTKDYLQMQDKDKSKLFIKTKNAVMGVRGTDFMISTNGINTATVLFEGEIVFNKLEARSSHTTQSLEAIVDRGVKIYPGEFSVMEANRPMPTVPSLLNIQQREQLEKNTDFSSDRTPSNAGFESGKTVVPEGLDGQKVSNNTEVLKSEVAQISAVETPKKTNSLSSENPDGFVRGDEVKPANGSFVHIESGVIIPPGPDAVLDANTNTYIPGSDSGKVASDGSYIPPKNVEITNDGKILVALPNKNGVLEVKELPPVSPVKSADSRPFKNVLPGRIPSNTGLPIGPQHPRGSNGVDTRFSPTGGIENVNDPQRVNSPIFPTTIRVNSN